MKHMRTINADTKIVSTMMGGKKMKTKVHKILLYIVILGWIGSFGAVFFPSWHILWFVWVVPLTIYLFLCFLKPFGIPDTDLPTEGELKEMIKNKESK
jgi:fatty acid desaturase